MEAAKEGHFNCVEVLAEIGPDVNKEDSEQRTAVIYATMRGTSNRCLEVLIRKGASVNKQDIYKFTPLIFAACSGNREDVGLLIRAGADVNSCTILNCTALACSIERGYIKCSEMLVEAGADVNITSLFSGFNSLLMLAVQKNSYTIANLLLKAGAVVNSRNSDGETALINAIERGNVYCVNLLIQAGADVNIIYQNDETALMLALLRSHTQCVSMVINAGADVNARSRTGETALSYALTGRSDACIRLMIESGADGHGSVLLRTLVASETPGNFMECMTDVKIKALLRTGAMVNTVDNLVSLCFKSPRRRQRKKELALLLFAAGEKMFTKDFNAIYPSCPPPPKIYCLTVMSWYAIREHLLQLNKVNLFYRVPKLGLPASLTKYFLFEQSVTE